MGFRRAWDQTFCTSEGRQFSCRGHQSSARSLERGWGLFTLPGLAGEGVDNHVADAGCGNHIQIVPCHSSLPPCSSAFGEVRKGRSIEEATLVLVVDSQSFGPKRTSVSRRILTPCNQVSSKHVSSVISTSRPFWLTPCGVSFMLKAQSCGSSPSSSMLRLLERWIIP